MTTQPATMQTLIAARSRAYEERAKGFSGRQAIIDVCGEDGRDWTRGELNAQEERLFDEYHAIVFYRDIEIDNLTKRIEARECAALLIDAADERYGAQAPTWDHQAVRGVNIGGDSLLTR